MSTIIMKTVLLIFSIATVLLAFGPISASWSFMAEAESWFYRLAFLVIIGIIIVCILYG